MKTYNRDRETNEEKMQGEIYRCAFKVSKTKVEVLKNDGRNHHLRRRLSIEVPHSTAKCIYLFNFHLYHGDSYK